MSNETTRNMLRVTCYGYKKFFQKIVIFSLSIFILTSLCHASETGNLLTLEDIIAITIEKNPDIKAAKEKVASFEAAARGSGKWPNPELIIGPNTGSIERKENILLSQLFDISGKFHLKGEKADREAFYEACQLQEVILETSLHARLGYYDYCTAFELYKLQKKNTEIFKKALEKSEIEYNLGNIPQAEFLRFQLEEARAVQALIHAENQLKIATSAIFSIMGQYDKKNIDIAVPDINSNPIKIKEVKEEEITQEALAKRPVIKGQEALISVKEYEISIAKRERFPDLTVSYRRDSNREHEPEENGVVFRFALPVFDYGSIGSQIDMAEAGQRQEEAMLSSVKIQVKLEAEKACYELVEARSLLTAFRDKILVNSDDLLWKAQYGYEEGAFSYLEFMDAMKTYNEIQREYIEAVYKYYGAIAKCERAASIKLEEEL